MDSKKDFTDLHPRLVLDLLDDQPGLKTSLLDWNQHTPQNATQTQTAPTRATATPISLLQKPAVKTTQHKLFREQKSLKQMIHEYNGRNYSASIVKKISQQEIGEESEDFNFGTVEQIYLPHIPGKILRPL